MGVSEHDSKTLTTDESGSENKIKKIAKNTQILGLTVMKFLK